MTSAIDVLGATIARVKARRKIKLRSPLVRTDEWVYGTIPQDKEGKKQRQRIARHRAERADRGFSTYDWWSADTFLTGLIANVLHELRVHGVTYPVGWTEESWNLNLAEVELQLRAYAEGKLDVHDAEAQSRLLFAAQEALHWVADYLPNLWD